MRWGLSRWCSGELWQPKCVKDHWVSGRGEKGVLGYRQGENRKLKESKEKWLWVECKYLCKIWPRTALSVWCERFLTGWMRLIISEPTSIAVTSSTANGYSCHFSPSDFLPLGPHSFLLQIPLSCGGGEVLLLCFVLSLSILEICVLCQGKPSFPFLSLRMSGIHASYCTGWNGRGCQSILQLCERLFSSWNPSFLFSLNFLGTVFFLHYPFQYLPNNLTVICISLHYWVLCLKCPSYPDLTLTSARFLLQTFFALPSCTWFWFHRSFPHLGTTLFSFDYLFVSLLPSLNHKVLG